jgi:hypothetical protein
LLTIGVGHVVFQVFGHHFEAVVDLRPTNWKRDATCLIWPKPDNPVRWPPRVHLTDKTLFEFGPKL